MGEQTGDLKSTARITFALVCKIRFCDQDTLIKFVETLPLGHIIYRKWASDDKKLYITRTPLNQLAENVNENVDDLSTALKEKEEKQN